jgi:hypothetical protein
MRRTPLPIDPDNRLKIEGVPSDVRNAILNAAREPSRIQEALFEWLHTRDSEKQSRLLLEIVDILYPQSIGELNAEMRDALSLQDIP